MPVQGPRETIRQFQADPDVRVFLLTRGQGAAGLTLTQGARRSLHAPPQAVPLLFPVGLAGMEVSAPAAGLLA